MRNDAGESYNGLSDWSRTTLFDIFIEEGS